MHLRSALVPLVLLGVGALLSSAVPEVRAQQSDQLPAEVSAWMERDQARRWVMLVETGDKLFNEGSCARCHGAKGSGGNWGPDLTDGEWLHSAGDLEGIRETIFWGVRRRDFKDPNRRFEMNPTGGMTLEWDEVRALAAYVWTLSHDDGSGA